MHYSALYFNGLYNNTLNCSVLNFNAKNWTLVHYIEFFCTLVYYIAFHINALHWITLNFINLTTLPFSLVHYTKWQSIALHWAADSCSALHSTKHHYSASSCVLLCFNVVQPCLVILLSFYILFWPVHIDREKMSWDRDWDKWWNPIRDSHSRQKKIIINKVIVNSEWNYTGKPNDNRPSTE